MAVNHLYTYLFILTESNNFRTLKKIKEVAMKIERITPVALIFALLLSLAPTVVCAEGNDGPPPGPEKRSVELTIQR